MLWIKSLHIIFMVTWFAGLFYLPRVMVYHAMTPDSEAFQLDTFKTMERKLMVMTHIGCVLTLFFGSWLLVVWMPGLATQAWLQLKLLLVLCLIVYHLFCVKLVRDFRFDRNRRSHKWYRVFNEIPVIFLFAVIMLVVIKPVL